MKVAIVNSFHPFVGLGKYAFNLFYRLSRMNKDVEMIYFENNKNEIKKSDKRIKIIRQKINIPVFNNTLSSYFYFPYKIPKDYELYHLTSQYLARISKYVSNSIITHMDLAPLLFPHDYSFHLKFFVKRYLKFYKNAKKIISISELSKKELLKFVKIDEDKIKVIPLGFDENIYKPYPKHEARKKLGLPDDKKIILNVGSEEPRKNIPTLLKAVRLLQNKMQDIVLIRVGRTDPSNIPLKNGLNIKEFQNIPEEQMPLFYSAADVFVFPAIYEGGFAYPPLEAMACGVPTLVTKELELFKGGVVILNNVADTFSDMIQDILCDSKLHKKLSRSALRISKNFTLTKEAENTYKVYEEVSS